MQLPSSQTRRKIVISFFVLFFLSGISRAGAQEGALDSEPPPVPVRAAQVERKAVSERISLVGTVEAIRNSTVAAEVPGLVIRFPVTEGDFVKKGNLIVELDPTDTALRLKAAVAMKEKVKVNLENAAKELERVSRLKKTDSIAEKRYDAADAAYRALASELARTEAEIEHLEYEIHRKKVTAPFSGFVVKEHTQVGQWLSPGSPVVTLVDLSRVRVTVDVPERHFVQLNPQSDTFVTLKSLSDAPMPASIDVLLPQGDPASRTFPVKAGLANPEYRIKSGMEALVTFSLPTKKEMLLVPKDAVVTAGYERLVYRIANGKAYPVPVDILGYYDGNVAVSGNLEEGEEVVIRGNERLRPGQAVEVK
ncbi:MAG: efflux RND transporter periplasmic adaptor subunit [Deltaproteobacteria bacterium]|nr:efflux RND transporter periplasmic adaptor subunit [Deltaproteobacteria bacterium]